MLAAYYGIINLIVCFYGCRHDVIFIRNRTMIIKCFIRDSGSIG